jgi:hypothetical protein
VLSERTLELADHCAVDEIGDFQRRAPDGRAEVEASAMRRLALEDERVRILANLLRAYDHGDLWIRDRRERQARLHEAVAEYELTRAAAAHHGWVPD